MPDANEVLKFWFDEITPMEQFMSTPELDDRIRDRFGELWEAANAGGMLDWLEDPDQALALIIVLDQFPRNIFRGSGRSFESDALARSHASQAIESGFDLKQPERRRLFIYMPFMHSEDIADQNRCLDLIRDRIPETGAQNLLHAKAHRDIIQLFGRFPYRNEALGRENTPAEADWMENVGYRKYVEQLEASEKA